MIAITLIIFISYIITLIWYANGFKKVNEFEQKNLRPETNFSILVPFRNESQRLTPLLQSLRELDYPLGKFEFIFIDDDSTDESQKIILEALENSAINFKIITNQRSSASPKKDALTQGVDNAKYDWILTTDADCALPQQWLAIYNQVVVLEAPTMVMGPIYFGLGKANALLKDLIINEANALQIVAIGALGHNKPILANGANLGYKKSWFIKENGFAGNDHIASGDDVFMLQKAIDSGVTVSYAKASEAVVYTQMAGSWSEYFWQRIRWASKTSQLQNPLAKFTGMIMAITNVWWIVLLVAFCIYGELYSFWIAFALLKMLADFLFLKQGQRLFAPTCIRMFIFSSLVYPLLSSLVVIGTKLGGYKWKNRRFKK